ncbi:hypothetical protein GOL26_28655 [Sinorhizobium medicae]|nr:hypothetical protein [Sinorhizobium medicae]MDX0998844.1 hypothetical protein [Sinorhizobium medicae]MDX1182789.1 hypothetical protein [Sinorhizobium medicae]
MNIKSIIPRAAPAALAILAASTNAAYAGPQDYEFQLAASEVKQGPEAEVSVKLIDKRTGAPVPDAVIFTTRMDMAPDGMETMTTSVESIPTRQPGVYRFRTNLSMEGRWRFKMAAKVQGEVDTVQGEVVLKAIP